jgi:hypothetical protein
VAVGNFQKSWETAASPFIILTPVQIIDRDLKKSKIGKTRTYLNLEGFTFVYIDNYKHVFLPVFRVDIKNRDIELESSAQSEFYTGFKIQATFNNTRTAKWEPVVEPCYFDIVYRSKENENIVCIMAGSEDSQEALCFNVSEELVEVVAHCLNNVQTLFISESASPKSLSLQKCQLEQEKQMEEGIYESQFLVRNLTGYDFAVQTVGDRKSKAILVKNQQEKFVNFIIEDEFSSRETINRSIILNLDQNVGQSKLN